MKGLVRYGFPLGAFKLEEVTPPGIEGSGDVLLEVKAAGLCGSDLKNWNIENGAKTRISVFGHEFAGEIVAIGSDVTDWKIGDRVVSDNTGYACGKCHACMVGNFVSCSERRALGWGMDGGFGKFVRIPGQILGLHKHALMKIPDNVSYEEASILDPVCNAYMALVQRSNLRPGEDVLIYGMGPLSLNCIQIARIMGAANIIVVGNGSDEAVRKPVAKMLGATHFIDTDKDDVVQRCEQISGKYGIPVVVDGRGSPQIIEESIRILRTNGQFVRIGLDPNPAEFSINDISEKAISLIGHMGYDAVSWLNVLNLLKHRMLDVESLITHRLPLSRWQEGFELMASRQAIKVVFHYDLD